MQRWGESHACWQRDPAPDPHLACVGSGSRSYHSLFLGHHYATSHFLMFLRHPIITHPHCKSSPGMVRRHPALVPTAQPLQMLNGSGEQVVTLHDARCMMCNMVCAFHASAASFHPQAPRKEPGRSPVAPWSHPLRMIPSQNHRGDSHPALLLMALSM